MFIVRIIVLHLSKCKKKPALHLNGWMDFDVISLEIVLTRNMLYTTKSIKILLVHSGVFLMYFVYVKLLVQIAKML